MNDYQWIDEIIEDVFHWGVGTNASDIQGNDKAYLNLKAHAHKSAKSKIISHIEDIERQASKVDGETSDGYHTFNELYEYRLAYNAALFNEWAELENNPYDVHKSHTHSDGEPAFGGGWFVVVAELPDGQISNHYRNEYWGMFKIPVRTKANKWDGHTPKEALNRLNQLKTNNKEE